MRYSPTLSLDCPYCKTQCQFLEIEGSHDYCESDDFHHHIAYVCTNCRGIVVTRWLFALDASNFFRFNKEIRMVYNPLRGSWKPRVNLDSILSDEVKEDFMEAINCYNFNFYNACMIMARRAIQQEMIDKGANGRDLYQQIESTGISDQLKSLLQKVKNFGNYGAHPDFSLFDDDGQKIDDIKQFAKLSLEFLDRYFSDQYEIDALIQNAPKSGKELNSQD